MSRVLIALRRVALGLAVVIAASAILLLSDLQHRNAGARGNNAAGHRWKIYFVQFNDVIDVEDAAAGVMTGLRESGLKDGRDFEVKTLNAQGDMATVSALIDAAVTGGADMLITFSTPPSRPRPQIVLDGGGRRRSADPSGNHRGLGHGRSAFECLSIVRRLAPALEDGSRRFASLKACEA